MASIGVSMTYFWGYVINDGKNMAALCSRVVVHGAGHFLRQLPGLLFHEIENVESETRNSFDYLEASMRVTLS